MFYNCSNLENITFVEGSTINVSIDVRNSPLTHDSLMNIIDALKTYTTSSTSRKLTIGSTNKAKLDSDEQQMVIDKGWTLA
jgi:hypothetical protein